jgi:hypothetical protein
MNRELAEHVSLIAAPILGGMIAQADPADCVDPAWFKTATETAIRIAHDLWLATLDAE